MSTTFRSVISIILVLLLSLVLVACGEVTKFDQELVTTADGLPTWQDIENGASKPPAPTPVQGSAPVFTSTPPTKVIEGEVYRYEIDVADIDVGDKLVVRVEQMPDWLELQSPNTNPTLTGIPQDINVGAHSVILIVVDLSGLKSKQRFNIIVEAKQGSQPTPSPEPQPTPISPETNQKPVAYASQIQTQEDKPIAFALQAEDADSDKLSYILVSQPKHGKIVGALPNAQYIANSNFFGSDSFVFRVNDGSLNSNNAIVAITVVQVNDAPTARNGSITTDKNKAVKVVMSASDIEKQKLNYNIVSDPKNGTLSNASGNAITYTPKPNFVGTDSFSFRAQDGSLNSNIATVSITVRNVAQAKPGTYRVYVDTDIGHDPDDIQSLYRLIHYSDILKVEGINASVSMNTNADIALLRKWIKNVRVNELRAKGHTDLMTEEAFLAAVRLGSQTLGAPGKGRSSAGSNNIIAKVKDGIKRGDTRPLYVFAWGPLTTVAQALYDSPDIAPYIRIYSIGSSNAVADLASRNYIYNFMKNSYNNLWWIENGSPLTNYRNTYFGIFYKGQQAGEWSSHNFISVNIRGHGSAGDVFPVAPIIGLQEGDSPTMLYLLSPIVGGVGNVDNPTNESWGGQFSKYNSSMPNYYVDCCSSQPEAQQTINKWRVQFLSDWKARWDRYK